jgi:hypothetical protein
MRETSDSHRDNAMEQGCHTEYLWLAIGDLGYADECHPFYARSQAEAEQKAQDWLKKQGERILSLRMLRRCPDGFTILRTHLPGERRVPSSQQTSSNQK